MPIDHKSQLQIDVLDGPNLKITHPQGNNEYYSKIKTFMGNYIQSNRITGVILRLENSYEDTPHNVYLFIYGNLLGALHALYESGIISVSCKNEVEKSIAEMRKSIIEEQARQLPPEQRFLISQKIARPDFAHLHHQTTV